MLAYVVWDMEIRELVQDFSFCGSDLDLLRWLVCSDIFIQYWIAIFVFEVELMSLSHPDC